MGMSQIEAINSAGPDAKVGCEVPTWPGLEKPKARRQPAGHAICVTERNRNLGGDHAIHEGMTPEESGAVKRCGWSELSGAIRRHQDDIAKVPAATRDRDHSWHVAIAGNGDIVGSLPG